MPMTGLSCCTAGGVRALGIRGYAISMPLKEACIPKVNELDASAKAVACALKDAGFKNGAIVVRNEVDKKFFTVVLDRE